MTNPTSRPLSPESQQASYDACRTTEQDVWRRRFETLLVDFENLQTEGIGQRREIAKLKREITRRDRETVTAAEVQDVFDHWRGVVAKRQDVVLGDSRKKMIRDRLREQRAAGNPDPVATLKRAIEGLAAKPYVRAGGGRTADPKGAKRYADLRYALGDEAVVERCIGYLDEPERPVSVTAARDTYDPFWRPLDRAICVLRREFGCDKVWAQFGSRFQADEWWSVCPVQRGGGTPMRIRERGVPGGSLELACAHGCLPSELAEAIRLLEEKRLSQLVEEFRPIRLRRAA